METASRARRRATTFRRVGWLAVAALTTLALVGPATGPALAAGPTNPGPGNPTCTDLNPAWTLSFKIDTGALKNETYTSETASVVTNWAGQEITLSGISEAGQTFNWSSTLAVSGVLVKAGNDNHALYTYVPPVTSDAGLTHGPSQQGISHLTFCGAVGTTTTTTTTDATTGTTTTTTTTDETTGTTTTTTTATTATTTTATTTTQATTASTTQATTASTTQATTTASTTSTTTGGGVLAATATPRATPPPTDTLPTNGTPSGDTWRLALLAIAGLLATLLLLAPATPAKARRRR